MTVRITKPEFNLREKLSELDKPSGIKGNEILKSETTQDARSFISAGRKNYIINGDFQVSQRGDYTSATTASNQSYYLDRWTVDVSGVGATIQQKVNQVVGNSSGDYYKNTVRMAATTSATGYLQLRQKMELHNSLFGKTVTVSAWVKSNHPNIRLRTEGGHVSGNWDSLQSHSGNEQWEKLSMTIPLTSSPSALVFGVILWGSTGGPSANHAQGAISSGDYFEFTDFQVEIGENATDFEHRTIGEELTLCQRYFYINGGSEHKIISQAFSPHTTEIAIAWPHPTEMRTSPTVDVVGTETSNKNTNFYFRTTDNSGFSLTGNSRNINQMTKHHFSMWFDGMSGVPAKTGQVRVANDKTAHLHINAEL